MRLVQLYGSGVERRRRIDKTLHARIMVAYVHGVSTCSVDLVAAIPRFAARP
ncbi:hypothetical protein [Mycolicibacterium agri]